MLGVCFISTFECVYGYPVWGCRLSTVPETRLHKEKGMEFYEETVGGNTTY